MGEIFTIDQDSTLEQVVEKMFNENVNSVLIVDEKWILIWSVDVVTLMKAIVPEYIWQRDFSVANFTTEEMFEEYITDNKDKKVKYFMLHDPKIVKEKSSILNACMKVTEWRQARVFVVDEDKKPLWIITRRWVKDYLAKKMWFKK